jgi:hypothetical protein
LFGRSCPDFIVSASIVSDGRNGLVALASRVQGNAVSPLKHQCLRWVATFGRHPAGICRARASRVSAASDVPLKSIVRSSGTLAGSIGLSVRIHPSTETQSPALRRGFVLANNFRDPSTRANYALAREASVLDRNRQPNRPQENSRQTSANEWAEDWHDSVAPAG